MNTVFRSLKMMDVDEDYDVKTEVKTFKKKST